jgi:hypothetical protein
MRLRGAQEDTADLIPMLRQQVEAQGLAQASWQVPVFCCDELQQPEATTRGVGGAAPSAVQPEARLLSAGGGRRLAKPALAVPRGGVQAEPSALSSALWTQVMPMFLSRKALQETWVVPRRWVEQSRPARPLIGPRAMRPPQGARAHRRLLLRTPARRLSGLEPRRGLGGAPLRALRTTSLLATFQPGR